MSFFNFTNKGLEIIFDKDKENTNFESIFGIDTSKLPDAYDISYLKLVQCRKHNKKRINKKWYKKYGYKVITAHTRGWKIITHPDGTYEFIK